MYNTRYGLKLQNLAVHVYVCPWHECYAAVKGERDTNQVHQMKQQTSAPNGTTNKYTKRNNEQVHQTKQRTSTPNETTNKYTKWNNEQVHQTKQRTSTPNGTTSKYTKQNNEQVHQMEQRTSTPNETTNKYTKRNNEESRGSFVRPVISGESHPQASSILSGSGMHART